MDKGREHWRIGAWTTLVTPLTANEFTLTHFAVSLDANATSSQDLAQAFFDQDEGAPRGRLGPVSRLGLMQLVGDYFDHMGIMPYRPDMEALGEVGPTDDPEYVQTLIDALTILKEDAKVRRQYHAKESQLCTLPAQS